MVSTSPLRPCRSLPSCLPSQVLPHSRNKWNPLEKTERLFELKSVRKADKILKAQLKQEEEQFRHDVKGDLVYCENRNDSSEGCWIAKDKVAIH